MSITRDWGTVREAKEFYGVSKQYIHKMIRKGYLGECRKHEFIWLIPYPFPSRTIVKKNLIKEQSK